MDIFFLINSYVILLPKSMTFLGEDSPRDAEFAPGLRENDPGNQNNFF